MQVATLASEIDFAGWRVAARRLRAARAAPETVLWTVDGQAELFAQKAAGPAPEPGAFTVPREFFEVAELVVLHRSPERFSLLYRLLWRFADEPRLMQIHTDPDVARARGFARQVSQACHKMKAFVRFRLVDGEGEEDAYVAWFESPHRVAERTAPFFARRFANMRFSILTPDVCVHWDRVRLAFTAGADPADAPVGDILEDYWRTYYASTFNPARLKVAMMKKEMPVRYWRNLPEARLIPQLIARADTRTRTMIGQPPSKPSKRGMRAALRASRDAPFEGDAPATPQEVWAGIQVCRRCDLYRDATQGVAGEGPVKARLMFVGEQPGDQEDLAGKPFVGPAGQMFDRALAEAGVPRADTYVTNAVKHFKHELRGKRRLHKTPAASEVSACRWWLDHERGIVRPRVIVALGATAALSVFGKPMPVKDSRRQALQLPDQAQGVITFHPSYLLRLPDAAAKADAYSQFVDDLAFAWRLAA